MSLPDHPLSINLRQLPHQQTPTKITMPVTHTRVQIRLRSRLGLGSPAMGTQAKTTTTATGDKTGPRDWFSLYPPAYMNAEDISTVRTYVKSRGTLKPS